MIDYLTQTFESLFPLVLLVADEDPIPAIKVYLGEDEQQVERVGATAGKGRFPIAPLHSLEQMESDTLLPKATWEQWKRALERKGQVIFYGPPGTGKTFLSRHLARHLVGGGDGFWELMQFHPAYAYEDFMEGIRPLPLKTPALAEPLDGSTGEKAGLPSAGFTYDMVPGRFLAFCEEAKKRNGPCVLIIDEINRAELSRVLGELMYLLEYRALSTGGATEELQSIPLAGGTRFSIPANVRLIGTMNTADRSIALVDHALRRRFAFIEVRPDYNLLRRFHVQHNPDFPVEELVKWLQKVNEAIADAHYELGVSFFLHKNLAAHIEDIWRMEVEPYLQELFFDRPAKAKEWSWSQGPLANLSRDVLSPEEDALEAPVFVDADNEWPLMAEEQGDLGGEEDDAFTSPTG